MTYEEFCERLRSAEAEMDPLSEEMKEVIRWAAIAQFDHLWTYLTRSTEKVEPLIVNRVLDESTHTERWQVSCPHGHTAPVRFSFSEMHIDEAIVDAARQAIRMAKHEDNPAREIVMGSRSPVD